MKNEDSEMKEFFSQMRETDLNETEIPKFELPQEKQKPSMMRYLLPLATMAAMLMLFFGIDWNKKVVETEDNTLVITMTIEVPMSTDGFMADESSMMQWKSPSDILIQEFED